MTNDRVTDVPVWLRTVVWSIAIGLAIVGIVLAVVSGNIWSLIAFAGLALPMVPVGPHLTAGVAASESRALRFGRVHVTMRSAGGG